VQLFRTFLGETREGWGWKNRRAEWKKRVFWPCGVLNKGCPADGWFGSGRRVESLGVRIVTELRIEPQN
jgi:hypothetical protein